MNRRLMTRILGAVASALVIVAVFVPYVSVTGFSQSIWQAYGEDTLYLPIMILAFGALGVILFAINKKVEFAYMSTGAIIFFIIMQTVQALQDNAFGSFGIGYYFLCVGSILIGLMTFINTKYKEDRDIVYEEVKREEKINNSSDKLETIDKNISIPDQSIDVQTQIENNMLEATPVPQMESQVLNVEQSKIETVENSIPEVPVQETEPIVSNTEQSSIEPTVNNIPEVISVQQSEAINSGIDQPIMDSIPEINPVENTIPEIVPIVPIEQSINEQPVPILFDDPNQSVQTIDTSSNGVEQVDQLVFPQNTQVLMNQNQNIQNVTPQNQNITQQLPETQQLDIFGQPIKK